MHDALNSIDPVYAPFLVYVASPPGASAEATGSEPGSAVGAANQRKSLALLAILAAAGERNTSRDRLLALLWPEVEAEKAGHRLAQVLYSLRRELGDSDPPGPPPRAQTCRDGHATGWMRDPE